MPLHGRTWFEKADTHRAQLVEDDTVEKIDLETMAAVDGNVALSQLAEGGSPRRSISVFTNLVTTFGDSSYCTVSAANLSIAHRMQGNLVESLEWCKIARELTLKDHGDESLAMALYVHLWSPNQTLLMELMRTY